MEPSIPARNLKNACQACAEAGTQPNNVETDAPKFVDTYFGQTRLTRILLSDILGLGPPSRAKLTGDIPPGSVMAGWIYTLGSGSKKLADPSIKNMSYLPTDLSICLTGTTTPRPSLYLISIATSPFVNSGLN